MEIDYENNKTQFILGILEKLLEIILTKILTKNNANSSFEKFPIVYENILNKRAPYKKRRTIVKINKKEMFIQRNIESY